MACNIERPDPQDLFNRYLSMFSNTVLGGANVVPESNEWYATSVNYAIAEEFYAISEQAWKERDPREACCENLISMAERDGIYPRPAVFAQGYVELSGTANAALTSPLEFSIGDLTFVTADTSSQATSLDDTGKAVIRVRALTAGEGGNITETTGSLTTTVADVDAEVKVCGGTFCQGAEAEECEAFRTRYLSRLQYQPRATNAWILDKLLEWPCATRAIQRAGACCTCGGCDTGTDCADCGCLTCGGDIAFYLMFDNTFDCGIAPASTIEEVQTWLFGEVQGYGQGQVEIGVCGQVYMVQPVQVNVTIDIVDCPTSTQLSEIRSQVTEFFGTLEPSQPIRVRAIDTIVANIIGVNVNFETELSLENAGDAPEKVFVGNCDLEMECDYMACLNELTINRPNSQTGFCS